MSYSKILSLVKERSLVEFVQNVGLVRTGSSVWAELTERDFGEVRLGGIDLLGTFRKVGLQGAGIFFSVHRSRLELPCALAGDGHALVYFVPAYFTDCGKGRRLGCSSVC